LLHGDLNCLSVIQFARLMCKGSNIGHHGHWKHNVGVRVDATQLGLIDGWLRGISVDLYYDCRAPGAIANEEEQFDRLLSSTRDEVANVSHTNIVQNLASWSAAVCARLHLWHQGRPLEEPQHHQAA
jgi:hypothetical protein